MRHPVTASGRMTRAGGRDVKVGWALFCDTEGCTTRSETRPTHNDLPLAEFQDRGWFIAALSGDRCPACVARLQTVLDVKPYQRPSEESAA